MDFSHCSTKKSAHSYFHNEKRKGIVLTPLTFYLALAMLLTVTSLYPQLCIACLRCYRRHRGKPWEQVIVTMAGVLKLRPEGIGVSYKLNK